MNTAKITFYRKVFEIDLEFVADSLGADNVVVNMGVLNPLVDNFLKSPAATVMTPDCLIMHLWQAVHTNPQFQQERESRKLQCDRVTLRAKNPGGQPLLYETSFLPFDSTSQEES